MRGVDIGEDGASSLTPRYATRTQLAASSLTFTEHQEAVDLKSQPLVPGPAQ
jgi:hypothetical protein